MEEPIPIAANESIPSILFLKRAFKKFDKAVKKDDSKIMEHFLDAFDKFPMILLRLADQELLNKLKFYRIITERDFVANNLHLNELKFFSHPEEICAPGRFNLNNDPVLYTANMPHTAIEEMKSAGKLQPGEAFYLSTWELKKNIPLTYISFFYQSRFKDEFLLSLYKSADKQLDEVFNMYTPDKRRALKYFANRIADYCLERKHNSITSAFGHYYLNTNINPTLGFILYPSVKKAKGFNYAFNRQLVKDGRLFCTGIQKLKLLDHKQKESSISLLEIGVVKDHGVVWKNFGYHFDAIRFINRDKVLLQIGSNNIYEETLVDTKKNVQVKLKQFLQEKLAEAIIEDMVQSASSSESTLARLVRYNPTDISLNDIPIHQMQLRIQYNFSTINRNEISK